ASSGARVLFTDAAHAEEAAAIAVACPALDLGVVVVDGEHPFGEAPNLDLPWDIHPDDSATILYSSGTTGTPKGIEHSHSARLAFALGFGGAIEIGGRHAVSIVTTPLYTNGTWLTMAPTMLRGGTIVLAHKFDPDDFIRTVARERCTHAFLVPT